MGSSVFTLHTGQGLGAWYTVQRVLCSILCPDRVRDEVITSLLISSRRLPRLCFWCLSCHPGFASVLKRKAWVQWAEGKSTGLGSGYPVFGLGSATGLPCDLGKLSLLFWVFISLFVRWRDKAGPSSFFQQLCSPNSIQQGSGRRKAGCALCKDTWPSGIFRWKLRSGLCSPQAVCLGRNCVHVEKEVLFLAVHKCHMQGRGRLTS